MSTAIPGALAGSYSQKKSNRASTPRNIPGTVVLRDANGAFDGIASTVADNAITSAKIADGAIVDDDISGSAAIGLSKLATGALPTGITVASANIVNGTIVNDDVNNNAAITGTKIVPNFGNQNIFTTGYLFITPDGDAATVISRATTDQVGPSLQLRKWRGTHASPSIVANGDVCGSLFFFGYDGDELNLAASIDARVDGATANNDIPGRLTFYTAPAADGGTSVLERMRITSGGNVGINTQSPAQRLDVNGNARVTNTLFFNTAAGQFRFASFQTNQVTRWDIGASDAAETGSNAGTNFFIHRFADNGNFIDAPFSILRSSGNVGINNTNPGVKLDVSVPNEGDFAIRAASPTGTISLVPDATNGHFVRYGGPGAAAGVMRFVGPGDVERVRIDSSGRLGVGTNNPTQTLQIGNGSALTIAYIRGDTAGYGAGVQIHNDNTGDSAAAFLDFGLGTNTAAASIQGRKQSDGSSDIVSQPSSVSGVRFDLLSLDGSTARVGVGTTVPAERLHVSGGDLRLERVANTDGAVTFAAVDTYIYGNTSTNAIAIGTDSTNRLIVSNNGVDWVGNLGMTSATTANAATAGTSGALPAQVAGYLVVSINGTSRKIPYYAT